MKLQFHVPLVEHHVLFVQPTQKLTGEGSSTHVHHKAATSSHGKIASATVLGMQQQVLIAAEAVGAAVVVAGEIEAVAKEVEGVAAVEQALFLQLESQ